MRLNLYENEDVDWNEVEQGNVYTYIELKMDKDFDSPEEVIDFLKRENEWVTNECVNCIEAMVEKGSTTPNIYFSMSFNDTDIDFIVDPDMFETKLKDAMELNKSIEYYEECARIRDLQEKIKNGKNK